MDIYDQDLNNALNQSFEESTNYGREVLDNNINYYLTKLLPHKRKKNEICCICMDEDLKKLMYLPCCDEKISICSECLKNTLTKTSINCPACRKNLKESIENYIPTQKSLKASNKIKINRKDERFIPNSNYKLCYKRFDNSNQNLLKIWIPIESRKDKIKYKNRETLTFCDTNLLMSQQKYIFDFCKKYRKHYNKNEINDEEMVWNTLKNYCKKFYKNYKNKDGICNNIFNQFINYLNNFLDDNIKK